MFDLVCLRSFVHIYERGTVAAAASDLGYTAPAVSQHLAKLERDLGVGLFDRVGGRLRPSPAAAELVDLAESILDLAERCGHLTTTAPETRPIVIAAFASAVTAVVGPALPTLAGRPVAVFGTDDEEALRRLRLGHADIALVQRYDHTNFVEDPRLVYREVARDRLRLVLPPDRPPSTRLVDLAGADWLLNGDNTACTISVLSLLDSVGVTPVVRGSLDDNHALLALVAAGLGACILPEFVVAELSSHVHVTVTHDLLGASRSILAVTRRSGDRSHTEVVASLVEARRGSDANTPR